MAAKARCPVCGSTDVRVEAPKDYLYDHCGLSRVHLLGKGVMITDCRSCGNETTTVLQEAQLSQVLGLTIILAGPGITGEQLRYLRKLFEMTQDELARSLGKERRETVAEWESLGTKPLFKSPFEELSLRVILMSLFEARVMDSDFCCLSHQHRAEFARAVNNFVERARKLVTAREKRVPIKIRRQNRSSDWSAADSMAC